MHPRPKTIPAYRYLSGRRWKVFWCILTLTGVGVKNLSNISPAHTVESTTECRRKDTKQMLSPLKPGESRLWRYGYMAMSGQFGQCPYRLHVFIIIRWQRFQYIAAERAQINGICIGDHKLLHRLHNAYCTSHIVLVKAQNKQLKGRHNKYMSPTTSTRRNLSIMKCWLHHTGEHKWFIFLISVCQH